MKNQIRTGKRTDMNLRRPNFIRTSSASGLLILVAAFFAVQRLSAESGRHGDDRLTFRNVRAQSEQFIDYSSSIRLTAAQERIKAEALEAIPAPCCKDYSMKTCCCPCNLAKSAWGLSHYLIAKKGYSATEVKKAVVGWVAFINPKGFTGNACFQGGCKRPFKENGCGGMDATQVILGDEVQ